jgi:decaprenyl-phosphate phosphoribosyltransferase
MNPLMSLKIMRPHQWLKNLMLFFPPFLGGMIFQKDLALVGIAPFFAFSFASSASYIFNDFMDLKSDLNHPHKSLRPLTSGALSKPVAVAMIIGLLTVAVVLGSLVSPTFLGYLGLYLCITTLYSLTLKGWPIVDVFCISTGFVLRLYAGGEAFDVYVSDWLFLTVFLLALFLSLGKRFGEQVLLGEDAGNHRHSLQSYPQGFLESSMYLTGGAVLVTYAIYAIERPYLVYTVPLCMFGLLRYLLRVKMGQGGDPTESLLKDFPLLVTGILWGLLVGWGVYQ